MSSTPEPSADMHSSNSSSSVLMRSPCQPVGSAGPELNGVAADVEPDEKGRAVAGRGRPPKMPPVLAGPPNQELGALRASWPLRLDSFGASE